MVRNVDIVDLTTNLVMVLEVLWKPMHHSVASRTIPVALYILYRDSSLTPLVTNKDEIPSLNIRK